jgi:hypothetical protein
MSESVWTISSMILTGRADVFGGKSAHCHFVVHGLVLPNPAIHGRKPASICQGRQNVTFGGTNNDPSGRKSWDKDVGIVGKSWSPSD